MEKSEPKNLLAEGQLKLTRGDWAYKSYLDLKASKPFTIFESEQEPGLVAWPALWRTREGALRMVFTEVKGDPFDWPPRYAFGREHPESRHAAVQRYFESEDGGKTWHDLEWLEENDPLWLVNSDPHCVRVLEQADGSLLRICHRSTDDYKLRQEHVAFDAQLELGGHHPFRGVPGEEIEIYPQFFTVQQSFDGGRHWETVFSRSAEATPDMQAIEKSTEPGVKINFDWWATGSRVLEDGAIAWIGRTIETCPVKGAARTVLSIAESGDAGKTWSEPVVLLRNTGFFHSRALTEEADFVPLGAGRYLTLVRTDTMGHCVQLVLKRESPGHWSVEDERYSMVPHSGFPFLLKCSDGPILHQSLGGHWSTLDEGESWVPHQTMECYYGQMMEVEPGRVLAISQADAGDEPYPHLFDASLRACFLNYEKRPELRQTDSRADMAFAVTDGLDKDRHLLAQIQVNGCAGLIARASADLKSYYALVIECGAGRERFGGAAPPAVSRVSVLLYRVTAGKAQALAQRTLDKEVPAGEFIDVQFIVRGDTLMAAVRPQGGRATYLSGRDAALEAGSWGVFSDLSEATFRKVQAVAEPMLIRDGWALLS